MEKLLKLFLFIPAPKETGKFVWAIIWYFVILPTINMIISAVLGFTVILAPVAFILAPVLGIYSLLGLIFAIMSYAGYDFKGNKA
jgi:hypothetical protein